MYIYHWNYLQFLNKVIIMKGIVDIQCIPFSFRAPKDV
jgi:hypothetical protein